MEFSSASKKNGNVTFTAIAKPLHIRLDDAQILWEPSAYGGDGTELRQNITLTVSDEMRQRVEAMEATLNNPTSCQKDNAVVKSALTKCASMMKPGIA